MDRSISRSRRLLLVVGFGIASSLGLASAQAQGLCGGVDYPFPYTDVSGVGAAFCPGIMEAYVTGVSKGTSPTTFSPNENVTRVQMTTFLQRSLDQGLMRNNRRAAEEQWWLPQSIADVSVISLPAPPVLCKPDHDFIWAAVGDTVVRVDASTGSVVGTWTGATNAYGIVAAAGEIYVTGNTSPGSLYVIDPTLPPGPVETLFFTPGDFPKGIAFDGASIWTANGNGTVNFFNLENRGVGTISGLFTEPFGVVFDGSHMWVTDLGAHLLFEFDSIGRLVQTVETGIGPAFPVFDGANIWVPNSGNSSITVVQASTGAVVATIAGVGLSEPATAAFDGERILVTNQNNDTVTLFKAADLSLIGNIPLGTGRPYGACSDGLNFWVTDNLNSALLRI